MATATDPRRVDAHRGFKESNICRAKSYKGREYDERMGRIWAYREHCTKNTT